MSAKTKIINLKTNYEEQPIGIETSYVNFSWQMDSNHRGAKQQTYQILVKKQGRTIWDSGKVFSANSFAIPCPMIFENRTTYEWQVNIEDERGNLITSEKTYFETGVSEDSEWIAAPFICLKEKTEISPVFLFKEKLSFKTPKARLYITALGVYQIATNGKLIKEKESLPILNPGYGNGEVSLSYQTYDLTFYLEKEENIHLTIATGNGWATGMGETIGQPAIKALLVLTDECGETIYSTNTKKWQATLEGGLRKNGIYYGEDYAANYIAVTEFFEHVVKTEELTSREYLGEIVSRNGLNGKLLLKQAFPAISGVIYQGTKEHASYIGGEINVRRCWITDTAECLYPESEKVESTSIFGGSILLKPGETFLLDFGQNITAVPSLQVKSVQYTKVTMKFSEILNDGRDWDQEAQSKKGDGPKGSPYFKNLRNARSSVVFTTSNREVDRYQSSVSFFGYRYMTIEVDQPTEILEAYSIPISSIEKQTGFIETNNQQVNQLLQNVRYGQLSNYFTTATDCPQRDERLFWSGDTQVFAQTALYNYDSVPFLNDLQKIMAENTLIKGYTPMVVDSMKDEYFSIFCAGWSDALVINAWTLYIHTGNVAFLEENYPSLVTYFDFLTKHERMPGAAPLFGDKNCGDWLSFQGTNVAMMGDYYNAYVVLLLKKIAIRLKRVEDVQGFQSKFETIKETFHKNHVAKSEGFVLLSGDITHERYQFFGQGDGKKGGVWEDNSQTALLWFLKLGFYKDEMMKQEVLQILMENIRNISSKKGSIRQKQEKNTLAIGFLGVNIIAPTLAQSGAADIAYDLLLQTEKPSWLFEVEAGATTVWERWNSYDPDSGFGDSEMNSFNHYAYGSIVEWLYQYMLGIAVDDKRPGFRHIILQPTLDTGKKYNKQERIHHVSGSYDSPYGKISVVWESDGERLISYQVSLPANTAAILFLPIQQNQQFLILPEGVEKEKTIHNGVDVIKLILTAGKWNFRLSIE